MVGVLIARYPTNYQPFAIVLGLPVVGLTLIHFIRLTRHKWAVSTLAVGIAATTCAVLFAGMLYENWPAIQALTQTIYPGSRRSTGLPQSAWSFFSAPATAPLANTDQIVGSNASEIATGFTFTAAWAGVLLISRSVWRRADPWILVPAIGSAVVWLAWMTVDWGSFGRHIPIMNLVEPDRAGKAMVGTLTSIVACLVLSYWSTGRPVLAIAVGAAVTCGLLTAWGGYSLREAVYPSLASHWIMLSAAGVAAIAGLITAAPRKAWPLIFATVLVGVSMGRVNPITIGLGDLRFSDTARAMLDYGRQARAAGTFWASDSIYVDALFMATAVPSISGRQMTGPKRDGWRRLDPDGSHEAVWNRGGTFTHIDWADDDAPLRLELNQSDFITISISPCDLWRRFPNLRHLAASRPLSNHCLRPSEQLQWVGAPLWIYDLPTGSPS